MAGGRARGRPCPAGVAAGPDRRCQIKRSSICSRERAIARGVVVDPTGVALQMSWKSYHTHTNPFSLDKLILLTPLQTTTTTHQPSPNISAHNVINY